MKKILYAALVLLIISSFSFAEETSPPEDMVFVKGGCFMMGNNYGKEDQRPEHEVCLDDFFMDKYEVSQKKYIEVMKHNQSEFKNDNFPVGHVSWEEAKGYCRKLKKRLPTEAEWEYAARSGGKDEMWPGTNSIRETEEYIWYLINAGWSPHPVGSLKPNSLGIYDMGGNLWEWVFDVYEEEFYSTRKASKMNPVNEYSPKIDTYIKPDSKEAFFVIRGGSFNEGDLRIVSTRYRKDYIGKGSDFIGFRCAKSIE